LIKDAFSTTGGMCIWSNIGAVSSTCTGGGGGMSGGGARQLWFLEHSELLFVLLTPSDTTPDTAAICG
jgi:hypothetical protein